MTRGGTVPWWGYMLMAPHIDTMIYECDTKLGQPNSVECAQLEEPYIGTRLDGTIQVGPGKVEFVHLSK